MPTSTDLPHDPTTTLRVECAPVPSPADDYEALRRQKRQLLAEQQSTFAAGEAASPESFLARWPTKPAADADAASLLAQDLFARQARGESIAPEQYTVRFPELREALTALVSARNLMRSLGSTRDTIQPLLLPEIGEELFGFRLRHELGRGAFARVFLAEQKELGDRFVAVKISSIEGREPQTLAQMQHTHIVPIYSVQEDVEVGLRVVCMPYFGGASLAEVLKKLWASTPRPVSGHEFVKALDDCRSPALSSVEERKPTIATQRTARVVLAGLDSFRAAAWLTARLAEGLQHAHDRGILHRDIKPSNILVGADGQPMLLDFNLSADQSGGDTATAVLGGTIAYMSPEHLRALLGRTSIPLVPVDQRADIYSLGMVLFEILSGGRPFDESGSYSAKPHQLAAMADERDKAAPSLRVRRPDAPWGIESILRKCLAPKPDDRYQRAEDLAEDLWAFLEDRPLQHAPELSRREQVQKWTRRNPKLTSALGVALVSTLLLATVGGVLLTLRDTLQGTRGQLGAAQTRERKLAHDRGVLRAFCLVNTSLDTADHLQQGVAACEQTLAIYGGLSGETWVEHPDWSGFTLEERSRLREDTRELFLLLAASRTRISPKDPATLRDAIRLLDRAESVAGLPLSRALWVDRARYLEALGDATASSAAASRAEQIPMATARDHCLNAAALARSGTATGYSRAIAELDSALALDPRDYWSWFQRGLCHSALRQYIQAAGDFGHCTGLWPEFAWGHFNRAYVYDRSGLKAEAIASYSRAMELDPELTTARLNRGLARLELSQWKDALEDFDHLAELETPAILAGRGVALEGLHRTAEADEAFRAAFGQIQTVPVTTKMQIQLAYGFAVSSRLPVEAEQSFQDVLSIDAAQSQALYGLAMLAMQEDQNEEAIQLLTRALNAAPEFADARRYRAISLAREGTIKEAVDDINWCLSREPQSGSSKYAAACVAALAARRGNDPQFISQALDFLEKAFASGVGRDKAENDPDLAGLKSHPDFQRLLARTAPR